MIYRYTILSRYIYYINEKQSTGVLSSTKAEYRGGDIVACDGVWLKRILKDLDVPIKD